LRSSIGKEGERNSPKSIVGTAATGALVGVQSTAGAFFYIRHSTHEVESCIDQLAAGGSFFSRQRYLNAKEGGTTRLPQKSHPSLGAH